MGFFDQIDDDVDLDEMAAEDVADDMQTINFGDIVVYDTDSHLFMRGERLPEQNGGCIKIGIALEQPDIQHTIVMLGHFLTKDALTGSQTTVVKRLERCKDMFKKACPEYRELKRMKLITPTPEMLDQLLDPYIRQSYECFNGPEKTNEIYGKLRTSAVLTQVDNRLKIWKYPRAEHTEKGSVTDFGRGLFNTDYGMYIPAIVLNTYKARRNKK